MGEIRKRNDIVLTRVAKDKAICYSRDVRTGGEHEQISDQVAGYVIHWLLWQLYYTRMKCWQERALGSGSRNSLKSCQISRCEEANLDAGTAIRLCDRI